MDYITPIQKKRGVNDFTGVRSITLTPVFFSKMYEDFLTNWLKTEILELINLQQFENLKEPSASHYLVCLLNTILKNLENPDTWLDLSTRKHST